MEVLKYRNPSGLNCPSGKTLLFLLLFSLNYAVFGQEYRVVVDDSGRSVKVPLELQKVYGASPPVTNLLMIIAPETVVGLNFPLREEQQKFLPDYIAKLPVVGGWFGQGRTPELEALLRTGPQLVMNWRGSSSQPVIEKTFSRFSIPMFELNLDALNDYPAAFLQMGRVFDREERGKSLAEKASYYLQKAEKIAGKFRHEGLRFYYAEGLSGLQTECPDSVHIQPVMMMGALPVHQCESLTHAGMVTITKEKLLSYNPDIIIVQQPDFMRELQNSELWHSLDAVQKGRLFLIPSLPFNWLDRPPSFMRLLGVLWLGHVFYGEPDIDNLLTEIRGFFRLFLNRELTEAELAELKEN